ncbi:MAG TPA: YdeI/OmpD-associated family protein [Gemmatimonadales bacterium]|nr:YdeI/OmpD-associated family protein [Gemmatimonadales bacterium]
MSTRDKRVDAYIAKSADFAKPILSHLRAVVHQGCPEAEETLKWGMPTFLYKGKILCGLAAFKAHCTFGFWQGALIVAGDKARTAEAMGQFGRLTSVKELPGKKVLLGYIRAAMKLRDDGVKSPRTRKPGRKPPAVPAELAAGLRKSAKARAAWAKFSPSARREYIDWITEAKRPETRAERLKTTLQWVAEGKQRNWKYM